MNGYRIKEARKEKGYTQQLLAQKIGYSQSVVSDWEKGISDPSAKAIVALAQALEVSADYLLGLREY
ncbi:MAG: helix-turn-helix transcriptional regulator [Clostridia bacterium]|nr:helix-turn-helix transcriptional regulator [Clostridia bacterium]